VTYNTTSDLSPEKYAEFISSLTSTTVIALKQAQGNPHALNEAVQKFFTDATAANIDIEEIENLLGVNEPSIMDLAELSEEDEETVINAFENIIDV